MESRSQIRMARRRTHEFDRLTIILMIAFLVLAVATAIVAFIVVRNLVLSWKMTDLPGVPQIMGSNGEIILPQGSEAVVPLQPASGPTPQPWDGKSRVTLLLLGLDYRDWEAGETPRSDTMILMTIDPISNTAGILSIPRDMWVNIPGFDYGKINTAYYLGEIYKLPGGGPGLAMKTIEEFLGTPVQYYAVVDFLSFAKFIDHLGGLDIHVREEITIDPIGPGNTIHLYPGVQTLNGQEALAYARARYTEGGDFDRSKRQQEVIMAIRYQILTLNMLPTLIAKAPQIYNDISSGIRTNLNLQQVIQLAILASQIPEENIKRGVIGPPDQVEIGMSPDGLSILIPIHDKIRLLRDEIFTTGGPVGPATVNQDPAELMKAEQARVVVLNGSGLDGLAERTGQYLLSLGVNVVGTSNADQQYGNTTIIVKNGKPFTARYLADLMKVGTDNIYQRYDPDAGWDIEVIVGNTWANNNPMP